jgi:hypothetical protein
LQVPLLAVTVFTLSCSKKEKGIKPTLGTVTESVYASGIIKTNDQYTVYSTVNGILQKKSAATRQ